MSSSLLLLIILPWNLITTTQAAAPKYSPDSVYCAKCHRTIVCPKDCPKRNDVNARFLCTIKCGSCNASCTKNGCIKKGAICTDPRFVGGDGGVFYFHGKANEDFCIVSDNELHINGHFVGKHVLQRKRDFTWVQAIGILYGSHQVSVSSKRAAIWDDDVDYVEIIYDGNIITLYPRIGEQWKSSQGEFTVTRTEDLNAISIEVSNLLKAYMNVTYVNEHDSRAHGYQIDGNDCFTHLDIQFQFFNLSSNVDGVLGQTYNPNYVNRMKRNVPMPLMGGYERFKSSGLFSLDCQASHFDHNSFSQLDRSTNLLPVSLSCNSEGNNGFVCRR